MPYGTSDRPLRRGWSKVPQCRPGLVFFLNRGVTVGSHRLEEASVRPLICMILVLAIANVPISAHAAERPDFQYAHTSAQNGNLP